MGMKLHLLKIYLTNVLNMLKEQLCSGLRLCLLFEFWEHHMKTGNSKYLDNINQRKRASVWNSNRFKIAGMRDSWG